MFTNVHLYNESVLHVCFVFLFQIMWLMCPGSIDEDGCMDKTSIMLNKWYFELKKCLIEDFQINTGHGKCYM